MDNPPELAVNTTRLSLTEASEALTSVFQGTGLSGFRFDTSFTLYFDRNGNAAYAGRTLPALLQIVVESNIRVGTATEWKVLVKRLAPKDAVEPEEPVTAYELARLRWAAGSGVRRVSLTEQALVVTLECGADIVIGNATNGGRSWTITSRDLGEEDSPLVLVREGGATYRRLSPS